MRRRHFLQLAACAAAGALVERTAAASDAQISLRIAPISGELAPGVMVKAIGASLPATVAVTNAAAVGVSGWIGSGDGTTPWHSAGGPDEVIHVLLEKRPEEPWSSAEMEFPRLQPRRRYRLRIMNATASDIPVHLPGHRVELTRVNQAPVSGIFTDTIRLERYSVVDADLII